MTANKIKAWSFSRYSVYNQCPYKAKLTILEKLKEPANAGMKRGADMHDEAEAYIKGEKKTLSADLKPAKKELDKIKKLWAARLKLGTKGMAPVVEDTWAFTAEWTLTRWDDWVRCVLRVKLDVGFWLDENTFRIRDWKSGKFSENSSEEYQEQLDLYALAALLVYPHAEYVIPDLYYIDAGFSYPPNPVTYTRADIPRLKKAWAKRTRAMLNDAKFSPRPGWYCPGCYFNKSTEYGWGKNKQSKPAGPCKF